MSDKFFMDNKSINSQPISVVNIYIIGILFAYFITFASSLAGVMITILVYLMILFVINHHLKNNWENVNILATRLYEIQTQLDKLQNDDE